MSEERVELHFQDGSSSIQLRNNSPCTITRTHCITGLTLYNYPSAVPDKTTVHVKVVLDGHFEVEDTEQIESGTAAHSPLFIRTNNCKLPSYPAALLSDHRRSLITVAATAAKRLHLHLLGHVADLKIHLSHANGSKDVPVFALRLRLA